MEKRYLSKKLEYMKKYGVFVEGFLHQAPHKNFRLPEMVCETNHSPFIQGINEDAEPVKIILAFAKFGESERCTCVLENGRMVYSDFHFHRANWLEMVLIVPVTVAEESDVLWFIKEIQIEAGL